MLWLVIGACIFSAVWISHAVEAFRIDRYDVAYPTGVLVFFAGMVLRWWSIIHLGRYFTVNVAIAEDHRIVDDGPYTHLRHPSYTGALLSFLGAGLLFGNWLSLLLLVVPVAAMFLIRMRIEERALTRALGGPYIAYMARTKRLLPFIY